MNKQGPDEIKLEALEPPYRFHQSHILNRADEIINGERQDVYGNPEDSFKIIADLWAAYLNHRPDRPFSGHDVAVMMALFKIARTLGQKPHADNYVDACGYLAIAGTRVS